MTCLNGAYADFDMDGDGVIDTKLATCEPQTCDAVPVREDSTTQCNDDTLTFGTICKLLCSPGYFYTKEGTGANTIGLPGIEELGDGGDLSECHVLAGEPPETPPRFHVFGRCEPRSCGDLNPGLLAGGMVPGFIVLDSYTSKIMGGRVNAECPEGYEPVVGSTAFFACATESQVPGAAVEWKGTFACTKKRCPPMTEKMNGVFICDPGDNLYLDVCQMTCNPGYSLFGGNGQFTCGPNNRFENTTGGYCKITPCSAPPLVANAESVNCTGEVEHGEICSVTCAEGYEAQDYYQCNFGIYISEPVCVPGSSPDGKVVTKVVPYVSSSLDFVIIVPPGTSVNDLVDDPDFRAKMQEIIAINLPSAAILGITLADVTIISIIVVTDEGIGGERRLKEISERLLRGSTVEQQPIDFGVALVRRLNEEHLIRIDYKVRLKDDAAVFQLTQELEVKQKLFKQQLKEGMESIDGMNVTVSEVKLGKSEKLMVTEVFIEKPEEEEGGEGAEDNSVLIAIVVGAVLALLVLGGCFAIYKRRQAMKGQYEYTVK